jgi:hypothetical protein
MSFDISNYVEVNVRVDKFWKDYPDGAIRTEIISFANGVIVMKADVFKIAENRNPDATGHAYEKENSTQVNKTSAVENCETSAVGRALGIMGYEIKKSIASKEEVARAIKQQDALLKKELYDKYFKQLKNKEKAIEAAKKEYEEIKKKQDTGQETEKLDDADYKYVEEKFNLNNDTEVA